ncbi:molybdopterin-guanine dinucleotide biosynthesis protein B [Paludifilum halophilum]|uniref:Molybdopterin-guanine dinucleotide biosynthesis protein B n=1 Tax=Paludifilum halophilum TaxID=1642702 RepID=A0A235BC81_9BACL|nr:molybdopterin-guanine dinucleotide biosynthesis protein B [Paludifilum halophilum]OYD09894.1 molybdopterin-guanine dinucleotide biosynthesis protein B [Paludifilum halophilum]
MADGTLPPVVQFVGFSGVGKTTLIAGVIAQLSTRGLEVGTIKHHSKSLEMDQPGKDTWRHRESGARIVSITAENQSAVIYREPATLEQLLTHYQGMDGVLVEGYKKKPYPKLVLIRESAEWPLLRELSNIRAVVSRDRIEGIGYTCYHHEDVKGVACEVFRLFSDSPSL